MSNSPVTRHQYDEDFFAETRMSFGDHLEDLRTHLIRAVIGFAVAFIISIFASYYVLEFIKMPVEKALQEYHMDNYLNDLARQKAFINKIHERADVIKPDNPLAQLNQPLTLSVQVAPAELDRTFRNLYPGAFAPGGPFASSKPLTVDAPTMPMSVQTRPIELMESLQSSILLLNKRTTLTTLSVMETFFVYFKIAVMLGFVIGSPWIIYQIWLFVAAGLYPHERRYFYAYLPLAIGLFLGGVAVCEFLVLPAALEALLSFNKWLNIEPDLRLSEWLSFAIMMPVVTGLCFETPLAMLLLTKLGIFTSADYRAKWRHAAFIMCIFAAVVTPSVDPFSLLLVWVPMVALYFLGIYLVKRIEARQRLEDLEEEIAYQPAAEVNDS